MNIPISRTPIKAKEDTMEFSTFYEYFLYTKSWAYIMMLIVLPVYVLYWNFVLYPEKKQRNNSPH
jgi:hypothetical protein